MFKRLLTFFALAAIAVSAGAAIADGVRQAPEPTTMAYSSGTECYLWNIAEKKFHANTYSRYGYGNKNLGWGTRAIVYVQGIKCKFTDKDSHLQFNNYVNSKSAWFTAKIQSDGYTLYTDDNNHGSGAYWDLIDQGNNVYRIAKSGSTTEFYGAQGRTDYMTYANCNTTQHIDWAFVSVDDYTAYQNALTIYNAAQDLLAVISIAPDGTEKTAAQAVYDNEASTLEQITAAKATLWQPIAMHTVAFTNGVRNAPVPPAMQYAAGMDIMIYNPTTGKFFSDTHHLYGDDTEAHDWGTNGCLAESGVTFQPLANGFLKADVIKYNNDRRIVFSDNNGAIYVDETNPNGAEKNGAYTRFYEWTFKTVAGKTNTYTISNNQFADKFVGESGDRVKANVESGNTEWTLVAKAVWDIQHGIYDEAAKLKAKIDEGKTLGVETTAAEAAYADASSTEAQLTAAFDALVQAIAERATVANPSDLTAKLTNPDFSNGGTGWTNPGGLGNGVMESYNSGSFDINQTVTNLKAGVYALELNGMYRPGDIDAAYVAAPINKVKIYAGQTEQDIINIFNGASTSSVASGEANKFGLYFPNHLADAATYFDATHNLYHNKLFFALAEAGNVTIGVKKTAKYPNDWCAFDNFKLTYYGQACAEAYQLWSQNVKAMAPDYTGAKALASLLTAYATAKATADANDEAGVQAIIAAIAAAKEPLEANIAVYRNIKVQADKLQAAITASHAKQSVKDEATAYKAQIDAYYTAATDATEAAQTQLTAYTTRVNDLVFLLSIDDVTASDDAPADMTGHITNPTFDDNNQNGWTKDKNGGWGNDDNPKAHALEYYHAAFDMYQDLVLPNGTYKLSVNAFNRVDGGQAGAVLYAKSGNVTEEEPIADRKSGGLATQPTIDNGGTTAVEGGLYCPNSPLAAVYYFTQEGKYMNNVYVNVTDNRLRIGVKQTNVTSWLIMDNFTLTYYGEESINDPAVQTVVVTDAGYATYIAKCNENIGDASVYTVQVVNNKIQLNAVAANSIVAKGTPLLLEHAEAAVKFQRSADAVSTLPANELIAATADVAANGTQYCLAKLNDGVAFLKVKAGVVIPAGKAYLQVQASGAKEYYMLGDDTDAISTINAKNTANDQAVYTLQGVRVANPTKGIYVRGGKKIVIK